MRENVEPDQQKEKRINLQADLQVFSLSPMLV